VNDGVVELVPAASAAETAAVAEAIARAQLELAPSQDAYGGAWRQAAIAEGVEHAPEIPARPESWN
jgi:hypothetical protein